MQVSAELQWTQQRGYAGSFDALSVVPFAAGSVVPFAEVGVVPFAAVSVVPFAAVSVVPFAAVSVVPYAAVRVGDNLLCINVLANCLWAKFTIDKCLIH